MWFTFALSCRRICGGMARARHVPQAVTWVASGEAADGQSWRNALGSSPDDCSQQQQGGIGRLVGGLKPATALPLRTPGVSPLNSLKLQPGEQTVLTSKSCMQQCDPLVTWCISRAQNKPCSSAVLDLCCMLHQQCDDSGLFCWYMQQAMASTCFWK